MIRKKSIKIPDFIEFLRVLRKKNQRKHLIVFLDNMSVHKSLKVNSYAQRNRIQLLFNVPYMPMYNGIEYYWNLCKRIYKKELIKLHISK